MAGIKRDFFGTSVATPGDGRPREVARILDRADNLYMNNGYLYLSDNTRVDLRTIIENPPGGGANVVTAPNTLTDLHIVSGAGSRFVKTTNITTNAGLNNLTVPNDFSAGDGNDAITLNAVAWPVAAPSANQVLTATNATTTAWTSLSSLGVTSVANTAAATNGLVVGGPTGAITIKGLTAGTAITITNDANNDTITNAGVTALANTGTGDQGLVVGGPTGSITIKKLTAGSGITVSADANQITLAVSSVPPTLKMKDIFTTFSYEGLGIECGGLGSTSFITWTTANIAILVPMRITETVTVVKMAVANGPTANGNLDVGIYDNTFTKLVSSGSTAQSGTDTIQILDIADTALSPGTYYFALASSSTTATFAGSDFSGSQGAGDPKAWGVVQMAAAFPLPNTITPAASNGFVPLISATQRTNNYQ